MRPGERTVSKTQNSLPWSQEMKEISRYKRSMFVERNARGKARAGKRVCAWGNDSHLRQSGQGGVSKRATAGKRPETSPCGCLGKNGPAWVKPLRRKVWDVLEKQHEG